jgi:hypothetical protein
MRSGMTIRALIIYNDFASAAKANAALLRSAQNVDFATLWEVKPWRLNLLRFPPAAEEALTDAIDSHLIVFAGYSADPLPLWLFGWLEQWVKCRRIEGASLAAIGSKRSDTFAIPTAIELASFAKSHGLSFVVDEGDASQGSMTPPIEVAVVNTRRRNVHQ